MDLALATGQVPRSCNCNNIATLNSAHDPGRRKRKEKEKGNHERDWRQADQLAMFLHQRSKDRFIFTLTYSVWVCERLADAVMPSLIV